jgi:3-amino-4-hydroxybenzoic acid synthase
MTAGRAAVAPGKRPGELVLASRNVELSAGETQWWFDARDTADAHLLAVVERSSCSHVVVRVDQHRSFATGKQKVVWLDDAIQLADLEDGAWVFTDSEEILGAARARGRRAGLFIQVSDLERMFPYCMSVCERGDHFVVIDIEHATYIPYELLLAKAEGKSISILRSVPIRGLDGTVDAIDQSLNAFATMERGIGVLFRTTSAEAIENLSRQQAHRQQSQIRLVSARVEDVQHTGLGHRVCVDTTSLMTAEEGMLVGSTGWGGLFICAEAHYLPHMNLREFRVNAGAVHSYIWGPNDKVMYLSEMRAGLEVLCVDIQGRVRVVTVGRAKVERRPLLKIRCSVSLDQVSREIREAVELNQAMQAGVTPDGERLSLDSQERIYINAFVQNDWHVRVMGADRKVRHSALVRPGDELLAHVEIPGRHTGLRVTEHILEQ